MICTGCPARHYRQPGMRNIVLSVLLIFTSVPAAFAADCLDLPPPAENRFAGDFLEYAEVDAAVSSGNLFSSAEHRFRAVPDAFASFGYTAKNYLLRFRICRPHQPQKIFVQVKGLYPDARVWFVSEACSAQGSTCEAIEAQRVNPHRDALFAFAALPAEAGMVYLSAFPPGSRRFPVHVLTADGLIRSEQRFFWLTGLFFGALAAIFLYNAALFLALRERINLYYSLYLLLFLGLFLTLERIPEDTFGHSQHWLYLFVRSAIFPLMLIPFALFNREFLQGRLKPWQNHLWQILIFTDIVLIVLNATVSYRNMMVLNLCTVVVHCAIALAATVQVAWGGFAPARIMLAGWMLFLLSAILSSLHLMGSFSVGFNDYLPHLMKFGSIAETLLFTAALGLRVRVLKQQAELFDAKLTEERGHLAGDLHDVLGSEFGEMQMKLHQAQLPPETLHWFASKARNMSDRIRDMVFLLRSDLSSATIAAELAATVEMLASMENLRFTSRIDEQLMQTDPFLLLDALRILQEWSGNCMKYGRPTQMDVQLKRTQNALRLSVVSDGKPFRWNGKDTFAGAGLTGIRTRTAHRHGRARCFITATGKNLFAAILRED